MDDVTVALAAVLSEAAEGEPFGAEPAIVLELRGIEALNRRPNLVESAMRLRALAELSLLDTPGLIGLAAETRLGA